ncbi:hypothetical protein ENUP19_0100G0036 [Entamoeba nuttalli]|uniref:Uncharacterized protein n=1 Tax=Entamoeba nuttalli TaxID=412467 RepID=A0ABQ0DHU2_9EUKA
MAILCYELYSRSYKRVGIMVGGYKMYHKYFIEGSLGFEIESHNTLKCPVCLGVTGGLFSGFKRGEVKENKEVSTEVMRDERKTEGETAKKEEDKKENKQFKCIIYKGKTKEEAICLVSKETVVVINQVRE